MDQSGIRPGKDTAQYFENILGRLTLVGGLYLALICIIPSIIMTSAKVQFYFGGTSLLIVVGVALETFRQIDAHRQSLRYDSFVKRGTIKRGEGSFGICCVNFWTSRIRKGNPRGPSC